jgi:leucyl aminopeptidase
LLLLHRSINLTYGIALQTVHLLQPPTVKVVVAIGVVRNNCGEKAYVADEIITARSGIRVRVNNTDAEGRMVMADILYHVKEMALCSVNPHIFTIATLTGHAQMSAGNGFSVRSHSYCMTMFINNV